MAVKSKASRIGVWIILGLLFVGLAGFGVGNFGGTVRTVATVGETEIDINGYGRAVQAEMRRITQATGEPLTMAEAQARGIDRAVLQDLLAQAALDEAARMAGVSVGDEAVREQILAIPAFQGIDGTFDREAYQFMLDRNGLSVAEFEARIRAEIARNLLQAALVSGLQPQPAYGDAIYRFVGEARDASFVRLTAADLAEPVAPVDEAAVSAFYDANPDAFRLPERKRIIYVWMTPAMVAETIAPDEAALRAAYEARRDEFVRPSRRMVERLGFADAAAAEAALAAIEAGETTFDALLEERGLTPDDVDLGIVEAADLDAAAEAVFALEETGVVGPLPSSVGPALFRVNAILTAQETPFESVRAELAREVALERAGDVIAAEVEPLNDLLAGGATLEDIAAQSALETGQIVWTGAEEDGIAAYADFRDAADSVTEDDYPEIAFLDDGSIFALRLDERRPPEVPPLAELRDTARALAQDAAVRTALAAQAETAVSTLEGGAGFVEAGLPEPVTVTGITRNSGATALPVVAMRPVFEMTEDAARLIEDGDAVLVIRLDAITPPPPDAPNAEALKSALASQAGQSMAQDLLTAVARGVEAEVGITVNQAAVNAVHTQMQ